MGTNLVRRALIVLCCSGLATPTVASSVSPAPPRPPKPTPAATAPADPAALYGRRARRLVQSYLRLKVLEMRKADLERARLVIERKLGIRELLSETPPPVAR
jgi:hypothetical protein